MNTLRNHPSMEISPKVFQPRERQEEPVGQLLDDLRKPRGQFSTGNSRIVARRLLEELATTHQLQLYTGFEPEFSLFHSKGFSKACSKPTSQSEWRETLVPATNASDMLRQVLMSSIEPFLMHLDDKLQEVGVDVQDYIHEHGKGQLESPLMPRFGLEAADSYMLFKHVLRDVANMHQLCASFMTVPLMNGYANGCHFNHSLWDLSGKRNIFFELEDPDHLSNIAKHWIGGLITHMPAMLALSSSTVNCYRRLHRIATPGRADWDINSRQFSLRVMNRDENRTFIENRLTSSASCPYHVMAATLAAGMDGLERELEPPLTGKRDVDGLQATQLPETLEQAIQALKEDHVFCERLGSQFIDEYIQEKEFEGLQILTHVDSNQTSENMLAWERYACLSRV